jgi:hypothetical protein
MEAVPGVFKLTAGMIALSAVELMKFVVNGCVWFNTALALERKLLPASATPVSGEATAILLGVTLDRIGAAGGTGSPHKTINVKIANNAFMSTPS